MIIRARQHRGETLKRLIAVYCGLFLIASATAQGYMPKSGYVPDSNTAVKIAEAVLVPVYGEKQILAERPFTAKLTEGVWTISGTLRCPDGAGGTTTHCVGGVAVVRVSKLDGRILYMMHGK